MHTDQPRKLRTLASMWLLPLIPMFGLVLVIALWGVVMNELSNERRSILDAAMHDTESFVATFEAHTMRVLKEADRSALVVKDEFERDGEVNLARAKERRLIDSDGFMLVSVVDKNGNVAHSSHPMPTPVNVSDRDYFKLHAAQDTLKLNVSKPFRGRVSNKTAVILSRRLNAPGGAFAGIVLISVDPAYFTTFYQESELGSRGVLGVIGLDGAYRARRKGHEPVTAPDDVPPTLLSAVKEHRIGSYIATSPIDHVTRLVAYRMLPGYDLAVVTAQAQDEALGAFEEHRVTYLKAAVVATLFMIVFFAVITWLTLHLRRRATEASAQKNFLQTLLDNIPIGVSVRTVTGDKVGAYVLWNAANEILYGVSANKKLGKMIGTAISAQRAVPVDDLDRQIIATPMVQDTRETVHAADGNRKLLRNIRAPVVGAGGKVEYVMAITTDITAEQSKTDKIRLASMVFESTTDAIVLSDGDDRIVAVNAAFSQVTGFDPAHMVGRLFTESVFRSPDPITFQARLEQLQREGSTRGEVIRHRLDGTELPCWVTASCVRDDAGNIVNYVRVYTEISELKEAQRRLEDSANYDKLTQLPNRRLFDDRLQLALHRAKRSNKGVALLFIDIDKFKNVNDTFGHHVGDLVLKEVASRLNECVRAHDSVCRFGGDEFAIVVEEGSLPADALHIGERIVHMLAAPFLIAGHEVAIAASIGIAIYPTDGANTVTLLKNADTALYEAKKDGGSRLQLFSTPFERTAA